jgi:hypothetical protein
MSGNLSGCAYLGDYRFGAILRQMSPEQAKAKVEA